jgi:hypothetical protein
VLIQGLHPTLHPALHPARIIHASFKLQLQGFWMFLV